MAAERTYRRLFEVSLLLLLGNGFLAVWLHGGLDGPTAIIHALALLVRVGILTAVWRVALPRLLASALAVAFVGFYPLDILWFSGDFVAATVRMMFLFVSLKLLIADKARDFLYLGLLGFLEILTASVFTAGPSYLLSLAVFLVTASVAAAAWQLHRGYGDGARVVMSASQAGVGRILVGWGSGLAMLILALAAALFVVLPRPFAAGGGFGDRHRVGFSSEVNLGLTGSLDPDPRPVMRVQPLEGSDIASLRWRGIALYRFDGLRWSAPGSALRELSSRGAGYARVGHERRADQGRRLRYRVTQEPLATDALFLAGRPERISGTFSSLLVTDQDVFQAPESRGGGVRYEAVTWLPDRDLLRSSDVIELFSQEFKRDYLDLPPLDPRVPALALEIIDDARSPLARARRLEEHFKTQFGYTLDLPAARTADPVASFLFERKEGHCEYFATSMALMLRTLDIPSRIVSGFAGGVANPLTGMLVLRSSDAHSWVEAYIPGYGWLEFDPTPPAGVFDRLSGAGGIWMYLDAFESAWLEWVVDFDTRRQVELAMAFQDGSREALFGAMDFWERLEGALAKLRDPAVWSNPGRIRWDGTLLAALGVLATALVATLAYPRLRRVWMRRKLAAGRVDPAASSYFYGLALRALARRGFRRQPWQSAEEFAGSIADESLRDLAIAATSAYTAARFGSDAAAEKALPHAVRAIERS
jgi:protein-glutamine gamma-glutamyltransferase